MLVLICYVGSGCMLTSYGFHVFLLGELVLEAHVGFLQLFSDERYILCKKLNVADFELLHVFY